MPAKHIKVDHTPKICADMDAYQRVLLKLYEVTGGKDTKKVDFRALIKELGYSGSYVDIFERMSRESWIVEDSQADMVKLTHWGVAEAKKKLLPKDEINKLLSENAKKCAALAKEFASLMEGFSKEVSAENLTLAYNKYEEFNSIFKKIREGMRE